MTRKSQPDPLSEDEIDETEEVTQDAVVDNQAAPSPPSTPGLPVPHAAGPARTPPTPPSTPGAPVQSWLVPPVGP
jgi:hypothetical protein